MDLVDWGGVVTLVIVLVGVVVFFTMLFATMRLFRIADDIKAIRGILEGRHGEHAKAATAATALSTSHPEALRR